MTFFFKLWLASSYTSWKRSYVCSCVEANTFVVSVCSWHLHGVCDAKCKYYRWAVNKTSVKRKKKKKRKKKEKTLEIEMMLIKTCLLCSWSLEYNSPFCAHKHRFCARKRSNCWVQTLKCAVKNLWMHRKYIEKKFKEQTRDTN